MELFLYSPCSLAATSFRSNTNSRLGLAALVLSASPLVKAAGQEAWATQRTPRSAQCLDRHDRAAPAWEEDHLASALLAVA